MVFSSCLVWVYRTDYFAGVAAGAGAAGAAGALTGAGAALLGAGAAAGTILELLTGVLTENDAQIERTQITIASVHVAFSIKSVVLR